MKTALPRIFSSSSYERKVGFVQIKKWLEQPPSEADIDSTLLVLGEAYSDNGRNGVHHDSAKKLIEIIKMISVRCGQPYFIASSLVVKILLAIIDQYGAFEFDKAIACMFQRISESMINMAHTNPRRCDTNAMPELLRTRGSKGLTNPRRRDTIALPELPRTSSTGHRTPQQRDLDALPDLALRRSSRLIIEKYLPKENGELSPGEALCLKAIAVTYVWKYVSESEETMIWDSIERAIKVGGFEAVTVHALLAQKIIAAEGFVDGPNEKLAAILKAVVPLIESAERACNSVLCMALCGLVTTIMAQSSMKNYLRGQRDVSVDLHKLLSTFNNCDFDRRPEFAEVVEEAKLAIESIRL
jgi:hypothetical protein